VSLKEPIVEGAWYEREDGSVGRCGAPNSGFVHVLNDPYRRDSGERVYDNTPRLTRRVYITPTDPAEVVADIRRSADETEAHFGADDAQATVMLMRGIADLVAENLGVKS
jgi:hypothetical protein